MPAIAIPWVTDLSWVLLVLAANIESSPVWDTSRIKLLINEIMN